MKIIQKRIKEKGDRGKIGIKGTERIGEENVLV